MNTDKINIKIYKIILNCVQRLLISQKMHLIQNTFEL